MIQTDLAWVSAAVDGQLHGANGAIAAVSTDTRNITTGALFIALKGPNFDAHEFAAEAVKQGASALLVERLLVLPSAQQVPQIVVASTHQALGQLAAAVKAQVAPKTVAVTGSSGKTTVKEMLAAMLATQGPVLATAGNFNNDIGCPLTLLRLTEQHQFAVIELGANHQGEIAYTTALTQPQVAIINNVAPAHVEGFGSLQGVYLAKSEIFRGLPADGLCLTPAASEFAAAWQTALAGRRHFSFARALQPQLPATGQIYASEVSLDAAGCAHFVAHFPRTFRDDYPQAPETIAVRLQQPGLHNVDNALVALAAALALGCTAAAAVAALATLAAVPGRLNVRTVTPHLRLIDDTYNANVGSVQAAIEVLANYPGCRILVLGDMGELGADARYYHQQVGQYAKQQQIDYLFTLGVLSESASREWAAPQGQHFSQLEPLVAHLQALLERTAGPCTVLVKGSRSARMERVVTALTEGNPSC